MIQFEATLNYLGKDITIKSDDFAELHQAMAGVAELNRDFRTLAGKVESVKAIVPDFRTIDGHDYYGVRDAQSGKNISFGKKKEAAHIPFFPKGEDGYYDPANNGRQQAPQRQQGPPQGHSQPPQRQPSRQQAPSRQEAQQQAEEAFEQGDDLPF